MNIHELEELATPGPWSLGDRSGASRWLAVPNTSQSADIVPMADVGAFWRDEDAMFVRHCRNNFMRALEEIRRLRYLLEEQRNDGGWPTDDLAFDDRLISDLEEVK